MKTLLRSLFLCFTILPVATYSQNVQTSAIPTANCSFTLFDVGSSGATRPGRINRWHNTIGNAESIGNFIRYPGGTVKPLVVPVPGDTPSIAYRNAFGVMVGFFFDNNFIEHGFVFANGQTTVFDYPGAANTELRSINRWGTLLGIASFTNQPAFMFIYKNGHFTTLNAGDAPDPAAISDAGVIVGSHTVTNSSGGQVQHGFVLAGGKLQDILFPGADDTQINDINGQGHIVGVYHIGLTTRSFMIKDGQYLNITGPGTTQVNGINGFDEIVGTIDTSSTTRPTRGFVGKCQ